MDRSKQIIRTSVVGIVVNVVLVAFKAVVGWIAGSIAILLDAVNNLSDALSSVITIVGTKFAGKAPDKKHPYGYGRIEYLTSVLIAVIVLLAGLTSMKESIEQLIAPETATYSVASLIIIAVAVAAKLAVGIYVRGVGKKIQSGSLIASGSDALFDAVLSFATLVAAIVSSIWGIGLEGILGVLISIVILKAGVEMLVDTLNSIIGTRADKELTDALKAQIESFDGVRGTYDLTLHNYGPTQLIGSVHIEVADDMSAKEIHRLTRQIAAAVFAAHEIILSVGIYASNDSTPETAEMKERVYAETAKYPEILQIHGFYVDTDTRTVMFDLIVDFAADAAAVRDNVQQAMQAAYPDYRFDIILDSDYSD